MPVDNYPPMSERGLPMVWENVLASILPMPLGPSTRIMYMARSRDEAERLWEAFSPEERKRVVVEWRGTYSYLSDHPDMKEGAMVRLTEVRTELASVLDSASWAEGEHNSDIPDHVKAFILKRIDEELARLCR